MIKVRAILRRRWSVLLVGLVLGMLIGTLSSLMAPKGEEATRYRVSQLIIANRMAPQQGSVEQDALRVTRGEVAEKAAKKLAETNPQAASGSVAATANTDTNSIEVSTTDVEPDRATARVQAYVNAFLEVVNADLMTEQTRRMTDLQNQLTQAEADLDAFNKANPNLGIIPPTNVEIQQALLAQRSELENAAKSAKDQLQQEKLNAKATLPYSTLGPDAPKVANSELLPVPKGVPFRAALLGLLGVVLSAGLVMIIERLIPRIDTREELVDATDLPVLAEIGYFPARVLPQSADGVLRLEGGWAEPYRRIRSAIQFVQAEAGSGDGPAQARPNVFMIASASPGEGKSTTTSVVSLAMAETGERTLVVGGDFRRPTINRLLGVPQSPGIKEHARLDIDRPSLDQIVHPTSHENLFVAPSGAPSKEVVGLADAAKELISEAVSEEATVIVDTSPVEVANDAIDLLPVVDYVIVIVRSGRTVRKSLQHTIEQLQQHGAKILGTALIGTPGLARQQYYYEGYYSSEPPKDDGGIFPEPVEPTTGPATPMAPSPAAPAPAAPGPVEVIQPVPAPVGVRSETLASQASPPSPHMPPPIPVPPLNPSAGAPVPNGSGDTRTKPWGAR